MSVKRELSRVGSQFSSSVPRPPAKKRKHAGASNLDQGTRSPSPPPLLRCAGGVATGPRVARDHPRPSRVTLPGGYRVVDSTAGSFVRRGWRRSPARTAGAAPRDADRTLTRCWPTLAPPAAPPAASP